MRRTFKIASLLLLVALVGCGRVDDGTDNGTPPDDSGPQILSFSALPESVSLPGQVSVLTWQLNAEARVSISPGVGETYGDSGSVNVYPTATTTYTLTATNQYGTDTGTATVTLSN